MDITRFFSPDFSFEAWLASVTKAVQDADLSWTDTVSVWMFWASLPFGVFGALHLVGLLLASASAKSSSGESKLLRWVSRFNRASFVAICFGVILLGGTYIADYVYTPAPAATVTE